MPLRTFPAQLFARLRSGGLSHAAAFLGHTLSEKYYEWRFGVDTAGFIRFEEPMLDSLRDAGGAYEPISYASLLSALSSLQIDPARDVFVDVGCGKGRALVVAAAYPFKSAYGIELSPQFAEAARRNLIAARRRLRCPDVQVHADDARTHRFSDQASVVLLYFSFNKETLAQVLRNLDASRRRNPRSITVIFKFPNWTSDPFEGQGELRLLRELRHFSDTDERLRIYRLG